MTGAGEETRGQHADIRARAEAATDGPWTYGGQGWVFASALWATRDGEMGDLLASINTNDPDAEFIAHARTDIVTLLDENEQLEKQNDRQYDRLMAARDLLDDLTKATDSQYTRTLVILRLRKILGADTGHGDQQ